MDIKKLIEQGTFERNYRKHTFEASINPAIAYALNFLAGLDSNDRVLDPCCGVGTILIERQLLKPATCIGVDINQKYLEFAKKNSQAAKVEVEFKHGDITGKKFPDQYFTKIISNLPFGLRSGSREQNIKLYRFLADQAVNWLRVDGKAVFITNAKSLLRNSFAFNSQWELLDEIPFFLNGLNLSIFVYNKITNYERSTPPSTTI